MFDEPTEMIFKVEPVKVATFELEDVKVQAPGEFDVGGTIVNLPTSNVVVVIGKDPRIVVVACATGVKERVIKDIARTRTGPNRNPFLMGSKRAITAFCTLSLSSRYNVILG